MSNSVRLAMWLIALAAICYVALTVAAWSLQGRLIYPAPAAKSGEPARFTAIEYRTSDGLDLSAGYRAAATRQPTVLFFHGNGADWRSTAYVTDQLVAAGYGVLAAEYRGYSGNPGVPSEAGLYRDGIAAIGFLRAKGVPEEDIVLVGNSLGSGVATELATQVEARALVLISPFDSLEETAARGMRWLPVRTLLRDRYDNAGKLPRISAPVLMLHGEEDSLIAMEQVRRLAQVRADTRLIAYPGWGHDLVVHPPVQQEILRFLADL